MRFGTLGSFSLLALWLLLTVPSPAAERSPLDPGLARCFVDSEAGQLLRELVELRQAEPALSDSCLSRLLKIHPELVAGAISRALKCLPESTLNERSSVLLTSGILAYKRPDPILAQAMLPETLRPFDFNEHGYVSTYPPFLALRAYCLAVNQPKACKKAYERAHAFHDHSGARKVLRSVTEDALQLMKTR